MSIRMIMAELVSECEISRQKDVERNDLCLKSHHKFYNKALLAIIEIIRKEVLRCVPDEEDRNDIKNFGATYGLGNTDGFNRCRTQMISAITKLCEEEK